MFTPDYRNIVDAASNIQAKRLPLYEHFICSDIMEQYLNKKFCNLRMGDFSTKKEYFRHFCDFYKQNGYDTVSFEICIMSYLINGGALSKHVDGAIKNRDDFNKYPWDEIPEKFYADSREQFLALQEVMPDGMKAIGGIGNGVFECVQDLTGYENLCMIKYDDPELYEDLFNKVGDMSATIWYRFLNEFSDLFCVLRFGDDLGYKSNTLLDPNDIRQFVIPQYKKVINLVHNKGKKFLLHSCGCIFNVMDDLIAAGIDAKHSNEDVIAEFPVWVEKYGDKIGNFGGIDTDAVCSMDKASMKEYIIEVIEKCSGHGGFAFGSGNSIPNYVKIENFLIMVEIVREYRKE